MNESPFWQNLCSFCGKSRKEVAFLIVGPQVQICDECVGLCVDLIAKRQQEKEGEENGSDRLEDPDGA